MATIVKGNLKIEDVATPFPRLLHFTFDSYFLMLNVKQSSLPEIISASDFPQKKIRNRAGASPLTFSGSRYYPTAKDTVSIL